MPRPPHRLRHEFETALLAHLETKGDDFERSALVQSYVDRGVSQSTVYRWVDAVLVNRAVSQRRATAVARQAPAAPTVDDQPPMIVESLPPIPRLEDVRVRGLVPVLDLLRECIEQAQSLMTHARNPDGTIRNARLLMRGSEHLRRAVETAAKLNETVAAQQEMRQFHEKLLEEVQQESPEVHGRILARLGWSPSSSGAQRP